MKILVIAMGIFMWPGVSAAGEWFTPFSKADWAYQLVFTGFAAADWNQTHKIVKDQTKYERCFALGKYPSRTKVDLMIGSGIIAHGLISWALPAKPRRVWQCVWIGIEADAVEHNYQMGITVSF